MPSEMDLLREKLSDLRKQRDNAAMEKGLAAEENKDLRENFAYDYWDTQERNITFRIHGIMEEIDELAKKTGLHKTIKNNKKISKKPIENKDKPTKIIAKKSETISSFFMDTF